MKRWKCSVCGHIHEGEFPPEHCPICGSPAEKFKVLEDEDEDDERSSHHKTQDSFTSEEEYDVLVVGSGAAAYAAAITAKQLGCSVAMLEKASEAGGTTARSGGALWIPCNRHQKKAGIEDNHEDALHYMARFSYPQLYNAADKQLGLPKREYALLDTYCKHASKAMEFMEQAGVFDTIMEINWTGNPQVDYMDHLSQNKGIRGRTIYTKTDEGKEGFGYNLIQKCKEWAEAQKIPLYLSHEVTDPILQESGRVSGLTTLHKKQKHRFGAKKGVIFGSGGYSHNKEFMLQFQRGPHFGGCAVPTNTGDFIKIATQHGAALGNMAGAFRAQSMLEVYLKNPDGSSNVFYIPGDSVLVVNKYGKRIMDEKRDYSDRAMTHFVWDPVAAEWTNMLQFMIFDERTLEYWQDYPPYAHPDNLPSHIIKGKDWKGLVQRILLKLDELAPYTGGFYVAPRFTAALEATVKRFNEFASTGEDLDFKRGVQSYDCEWTTFPPTQQGVTWPEPGTQNYTMYPLSQTGPYYAIILAAGTLDTNGGPVIDEFARVLDWNNEPIPGLYGAGNCIAAPAANAYWGAGGTIGSAMTFGYVAAQHLAESG